MKQLLPLAALAALCAGVVAPAHAEPKQASIPFVGFGSIANYHATDRNTLYVQDQHRRWYRATLLGNCIDLPFTETIGFDVRGSGRFDKFSTVIVRGQHCPVTSLVASGPPPKKAKKG